MKKIKVQIKVLVSYFFFVFLLISIYPIVNEGSLRIWSLIISLIFLILGLVNSKILTPLNKTWIKLGEILGLIIAPVIMAIVYFIFLTPISLVVRIFGKDFLELKKQAVQGSYWNQRDSNLEKNQNYEKQF